MKLEVVVNSIEKKFCTITGTFIFQDSSCHVVSAYVLLHDSCHSVFLIQWAAIGPSRLAFILGLLSAQEFEKVHLLEGK